MSTSHSETREAKVDTVATMPDLLTRAQVAEYTQITVATLARWAMEGRGPKFFKPGGFACRYRRDDLLEWLREQEALAAS